MGTINPSRMIADIEGEFLVFVIELQVHKLWQFWRWYPTVQAMTNMLVELTENKEHGLLNYEYRFSFSRQFILMYWRSYEHMHDWALNKDAAHAEGWRMLNKLMKEHPDLLGFWHESYIVSQYESFYRNVPAVGLGRASTLVPLRGGMKKRAARLREARSQTVAEKSG